MDNPGIRKELLLPSFGNFGVQHNDEVVPFVTLEEAYQYFKQLEDPASLWDMRAAPYVIGTKKPA